MSAYRISSSLRTRRARLLAGCALAAAVSTPGLAQTRAFRAIPTVTSGNASVAQGGIRPGGVGGVTDTVNVASRQVIIDWVPTDTGTGTVTILGAGDELVFT